MIHPCSCAGVSIPITPDPWDSSWPAFVLEPQRHVVLGYFEKRFGMPYTIFADYCLVERSKSFALLRNSPHLEWLTGFKVHMVGLTILRKIRQHLKPTTTALQQFGPQATRHTLSLSDVEVKTFLRQRLVSLQLDIEPGYVIVRHANDILGCGLYTPGYLRSQLPRHQVAALEDDLAGFC